MDLIDFQMGRGLPMRADPNNVLQKGGVSALNKRGVTKAPAHLDDLPGHHLTQQVDTCGAITLKLQSDPDGIAACETTG